MTEPVRAETPSSDVNSAKTRWVAPAVQVLAAGEAEVGTRSKADGGYTTS